MLFLMNLWGNYYQIQVQFNLVRTKCIFENLDNIFIVKHIILLALVCNYCHAPTF